MWREGGVRRSAGGRISSRVRANEAHAAGHRRDRSARRSHTKHTCARVCMHTHARTHTHTRTHTRSLTAHGPYEIPPQAHDTHTSMLLHVAACCSSDSVLMHFPTRPSASLPLPSCALSSPTPSPPPIPCAFCPFRYEPTSCLAPLSLSLSPSSPVSHAPLPLSPPLLLLQAAREAALCHFQLNQGASS